jgi:hypothetical protein
LKRTGKREVIAQVVKENPGTKPDELRQILKETRGILVSRSQMYHIVATINARGIKLNYHEAQSICVAFLIRHESDPEHTFSPAEQNVLLQLNQIYPEIIARLSLQTYLPGGEHAQPNVQTPKPA